MLLVTTDLPIKCYPALPRRTLGDWAATNSRELVTSRSAKKKKKKFASRARISMIVTVDSGPNFFCRSDASSGLVSPRRPPGLGTEGLESLASWHD